MPPRRERGDGGRALYGASTKLSFATSSPREMPSAIIAA